MLHVEANRIEGEEVTEEEILIAIHGQKKDIRSLEKRMDKQEAQNEVIQDLVVSVKEMAVNMSQMLEELKAQGVRLDKLEQGPAENWSEAKKAAIAAIVGGLIGIVIAQFF